MKRKFTDIHGDSDSDGFTAFQSRKRRRRIVEQSSPSQSEDDTTMDELEVDNNGDHHLSISDHNTSDDESHPQIKLIQTRFKLRDTPWNCDACTFQNETQFIKCEICDTKRTHDGKQPPPRDSGTVTSTTDDSEGGDAIKMENNDFKTVHSTKQFRKKGAALTKQHNIVDLTTSNHPESPSAKITAHKPIARKKDTKKKVKKKKKEGAQMSSIAGHRSRSKYYSNLIDKKQRKKKHKASLSKTESIESVQPTELLLPTKSKLVNMESISDDNECVIITKPTVHKHKNKRNHNTQLTKKDNGTAPKLHSEQWIDKYAPKHIDDLYLHTRKLQEIDEWFCNAFKALDDISTAQLQRLQHVKSILFLVGQSGIGKTSAIQCLCDKYNAKLLCYPTMDANIKTYNASIWDNDKTHFMSFNNMHRRHTSIDIRDDSQMNKLDAFLNRSKRFGSLRLIGNSSSDHTEDNGVRIHKRQVIWIRELPYVGQNEYLYRFRAIVEKMCNTTRNIVIFEITTEFEGTRDDLQIFGNEIRLHPRVTTIKLNPVNNTLMKKCLTRILTVEHMNKYIANTNDLIANIIANEKGDLRNAIQTLQMRLVELLYAPTKTTTTTTQTTKQKRKKKHRKKGKKKAAQVSSLQSFQSVHVGGREETLSLFHCLGKVLYAKKEMTPEEAIEKSDLDCVKFNDLLYENFGDFFAYNEHFNTKRNHDTETEPKEVDEFGFEMDALTLLDSAANNGFEEYCETLHYFGDADICCEYYNALRYSDTSTDLRSTVNHIQFGSQLYPAIYAASVAARGYLISHDKPPKLESKTRGKGKRGLNRIRGSTSKLTNHLRDELCSSFGDVISPQAVRKFGTKRNEHYVSENELALLRALMCQPTSLYVDIFPFMANINDRNVMGKECGVKPLCVSLIITSNGYSRKYEWKTFVASRFDHLQESMAYNNGNNTRNETASDEDKDLINQIEQYSPSSHFHGLI